MIEMETGTWEGVRFIKSDPVARFKPIINKAMADIAKRHLGLTDDQMEEMFIVTQPNTLQITPQIDPREVLNRKALHQQELEKLRKRS